MIQIVHSHDMPTPTKEAPWIQVQWLFDLRASMVRSRSGKDNFLIAKKHFLDFLGQQSSTASTQDPYWVNREFDEYILLRFKHYIDDLAFSSSHTVGILGAARQTIETAIANRWIDLKSFINFNLGAATRETDARAPYTEAEMAAIVAAINEEIRFSRKLLKPYRRTGLGRAPTLMPSKLGMRYESGWWKDEDNMRWYFENMLECLPITGLDPEIKRRHASFLSVAHRFHGGLHAMYRRWGVSAWIGCEIILPYLYRLVQITGINPTVAMSLKLDSFQEQHPLTGRAYVRYWKERGSGESDLHLDFLDSEALVLDSGQARAVSRIWGEVTALTRKFRHEMPEGSKDFLFVYQSRGAHRVGEPRHFLMCASTKGGWTKEFVTRHALQTKAGKPLNLTLARFRPSLVSNLVKRGVDIGVIQAILGHASIMTTYAYLESHDFHPKARAEVHKAIENIRHNRRQQEEAPKPVATETYEENKTVFATGLALCKNVFNPPDNIRKAASIGAGAPCTHFNMCLRCPNVMILEEHLPHLFALRTQYLAAMEQGLSATTHRAAVQQNIHILNHLLNPETSDWSDDVLASAERASEFIDLGIDPVAIREVQL